MAPTLNQTVFNLLLTTMSPDLTKVHPSISGPIFPTRSSLLYEGEAREGRAVGLEVTHGEISQDNPGASEPQWPPAPPPEEGTQQNILQQRYQEYVIGLSILIAMISIGVLVSVFMCLTVRRHPYLWLAVFGGKKTSLARGGAGNKLPQRVRFQINRSQDRDQCSTDSGVTMIVPGCSVMEEANPCNGNAASKGTLPAT